jgi:hypothetical protein
MGGGLFCCKESSCVLFQKKWKMTSLHAYIGAVKGEDDISSSSESEVAPMLLVADNVTKYPHLWGAFMLLPKRHKNGFIPGKVKRE